MNMRRCHAWRVLPTAVASGACFELNPLKTHVSISNPSTLNAQVSCLAVAPNGCCLASASIDGQLVIWDLRTRHKHMTFWLIPPRPPAHTAPHFPNTPGPGGGRGAFGAPPNRPGAPGFGGSVPPGAPRPPGFGGPGFGGPAQQAGPVEEPCALCYSPGSDLLAAGTTTGWIYLLRADTLQVGVEGGGVVG